MQNPCWGPMQLAVRGRQVLAVRPGHFSSAPVIAVCRGATGMDIEDTNQRRKGGLQRSKRVPPAPWYM